MAVGTLDGQASSSLIDNEVITACLTFEEDIGHLLTSRGDIASICAGTNLLSVILSRYHRIPKLNHCLPEVKKVLSDLANLEVAQLVPPQNGKIPTPPHLGQGNRADEAFRLVGEPLDLLPHQFLQNKMMWQQLVEFPSSDTLDWHSRLRGAYA
jgi:hypothetical protein